MTSYLMHTTNEQVTLCRCCAASMPHSLADDAIEVDDTTCEACGAEGDADLALRHTMPVLSAL